ncbi:MAG: alpha/beta hydrolase [Acidiferrobacterales bacterium]
MSIHPNNHVEQKLETKNYLVRSLSFPSLGDNGQPGNLVKALYYQSKLPGQKKLVIVLPIWGTSTYPSRKITKSLLRYSRGNTNVLRILGEDFLFDWAAMRAATTEVELIALAERMVERVQIHVVDIRRVIDWAEVQPGVDADRIGLIGFSMGAIVGSLIAANEPRIAATVLAMGGANTHEMFATCFGRAKEAREAIMARLGWTKETFEKKLERPLMPINAARFAGSVNPDRVIIFEAERDTCIPKSSRDALWHAMGQPQRVSLPNGHKMAFLAMTPLGLNKMRRRIYTFLEATL